MIPARLQHRPALPLRPALGAALVFVVLRGDNPGALLCGLALCAALVATMERRPRAMLIAAGIAAGLAPVGLIAVPMAIGSCIRLRAAAAAPLAVAAALVVWRTTGCWSSGSDSLPDLFTLAVLAPSLSALIAVTGIGLAAWIAASAVRPQSVQVVCLGTVALAAFLPASPAALAPLLLLMLGIGRRAPALPRPANDNPVFARAARLAA